MNNNKNINLMYITAFLQGLVFYGPVALVYRHSRGLDISEIFLLQFLGLAIMMVFEVPWGYFSDRIGYKKTLVISSFLVMVSKVIFFMANSFQLFLVEMIISSIGFAGYSGCEIALLYESAGRDKSQTVFSRFIVLSNIGFMSACLLYTVFVQVSLDFVVGITIIPFVVCFVATLFLEEVNEGEHAREKKDFKGALASVADNKSIFWVIIGFALVNEISRSATIFLSQLQYQRSGVPLLYFGMVAALVQCFSLVALKSPSLSKRFGRYKLIKSLITIMIISTLVLALTENSFISVMMIISVGALTVIIEPIVLAIENESIVSNRATILSVYSMFGGGIASTTNLLVGEAADISVQSAFILCAFLLAIALGCIVRYTYYTKTTAQTHNDI